jgi:hypothetical protein
MKEPRKKQEIMELLEKQLPYLHEKYGVQRIAVYGSFSKGNQTKRSDVDILVELARPLGLEFVELAYHLEKILKKKVDLATFDTLKRSLESPRYKRIASDIEKTLSYV